MPATHRTMLPARTSRPGREEAGFTLVEIMVVILIVLIMLAFFISSFRGTKRATHVKTAIASAGSYAEAIEAYMSDNGQVAPQMGSAGWPAADRAQRIRGPVDAMLVANGAPKPYMTRPAPEAVLGGLVDLVNGAAAPQANAQVVIRYTATGGTYTMRVEPVIANASTPPCVLTNAPAPPSGVKLCT